MQTIGAIAASIAKAVSTAARDHSINSSARGNTVCGIVRPNALAVFRLMISSNFVSRSIGRSPGLPLQTGLMFWFIRKKFVGSYFVLSSTSRW